MLTGQQIGPFSVEKELGSGAMGSVYRAKYIKTGKRVAIKLIAPGLAGSDKAMERFEREAAILKQLTHPNIVKLYATGKFQGTPFYAMEYIEGESLDRVMARRGRVTWEEVVTMGQQLCAALQHAHERGIIHRDLKPSNLMVLPDGTIKLTDFGIAKDLDVTQLTSANCTVGTAAYMSPEQCRGERNLTHKSDLYSLGVLCYELVTGCKPFQAETPMDMFLLHVQGTFERPSRLVLDIPNWLDTLICQLMEKKPDQRPLDAATVGRSLNQILEKVEARKSAGVEVVNSKLKDRARTDLELDEHDKEAARTLLGRKRKSKRKSSGVPFYHQLWFKAVGLSLLLIGAIYLIFILFLRTPTPDELYKRIRQGMKAEENWDDTRKGPIAEYLKLYPDRDDDHARQIHQWADQIDLHFREQRLLFWIKQGFNEKMTDQERQARQAIQLEESGNLDDAVRTWKKLEEHLKASDTELRSWGLLARTRLETIEKVRARLKELAQQVESGRASPKGFKPGTDYAGRAARAIHYEQFGDLSAALDQGDKLRKAILRRYDPKVYNTDEKSREQRLWFLLATTQSNRLDASGVKPIPELTRQKELIRKKLDSLDKLSKREKRLVYKDIITLYDDNTDLKELVKKAKEGLRKLDDEE
jgi:serine/threonine-protein kinase